MGVKNINITLFPPRLLELLHLFARTGTLNLPCFNLRRLLDLVLEGLNNPFQGLLHAWKTAFFQGCPGYLTSCGRVYIEGRRFGGL